MNALVSFRANVSGAKSVRREERLQARESIASNFLQKLQGVQRALEQQLIQKSGAAKSGATPSVEKTDTANAANAAGKPAPNNELGRDAYLRLLVEQLSNQDPLEPVNNEQMIAQLAQFSALEQMQNLNDSFGQVAESFEFLNGNIDQLNFISAQGLLGKFVEGLGADGKLLRGAVESVHLDGSVVVLTVDGKPMPMSGVIGIASREPETTGESKRGR